MTVTCGDATQVVLEQAAFDVVWGQGAWMHVADIGTLFRQAASAAAAGGRIAFEEACLGAEPKSDQRRRSLAELERLWGGRFLALDDWRAARTSASLDVRTVDDETGAFVRHFERLAAISRTHGAGLYPEHERDAFVRAIVLARSGGIRYVRVVARR